VVQEGVTDSFASLPSREAKEIVLLRNVLAIADHFCGRVGGATDRTMSLIATAKSKFQRRKDA
jgi:hypothetical protein